MISEKIVGGGHGSDGLVVEVVATLLLSSSRNRKRQRRSRVLHEFTG